MSNEVRRFLTAFLTGAAGVGVALVTASGASADPVVPPPGPAPGPVQQAAAPAPGPDAPAPDALAAPPAPEGTPHLASPDALPPGSTMDPTTQGNEGPNVRYLKDLWQAVQNHEVSGKEALLMGIAQRGMNTPIPGQMPGPNVPVAPADAAPPPAPGLPVPPPADPAP